MWRFKWRARFRRRTRRGSCTAGPNGIVVYSFETREYQQVSEIGRNPQWPSDSRRLLFHHEGKIYLADTRDKRIREVFSILPYEVDDFFGVSPDDRLIVFGLVVTEADVWTIEVQ